MAVITAMVMLCSGCSFNNEVISDPVKVSFIVENNINVSTSIMESPKRVSNKSDEAIKKMTDFYIVENLNTLSHTQNIDNSISFSQVTIPLSPGSHDISFIMTRSQNSQISQGIFSSEKILDTFGCKKTINITSSKDSTINITLNRLVYNLSLSLNDIVNSNMSILRVHINPYGSAWNINNWIYDGSLSSYYREWDITSYINKELSNGGIRVFPIYGFPTGESAIVTVEYLDSIGNVLYTRSISEVPLQANCITTITGCVMDASTTPTIMINDSYSATSFNISLNE